ncbi:hypothetical protein EVAR_22252_1 [Eumeta japonica]|uniref:Uncharacterized protein n=1 Tax=Eumeta variegata TaxID=151549 RepID=A0A4C1UBS9_EUMVA|nr:hypothetical protein EVAR_22252_1 [Eumeta japonica]
MRVGGGDSTILVLLTNNSVGHPNRTAGTGSNERRARRPVLSKLTFTYLVAVLMIKSLLGCATCLMVAQAPRAISYGVYEYLCEFLKNDAIRRGAIFDESRETCAENNGTRTPVNSHVGSCRRPFAAVARRDRVRHAFVFCADASDRNYYAFTRRIENGTMVEIVNDGVIGRYTRRGYSLCVHAGGVADGS